MYACVCVCEREHGCLCVFTSSHCYAWVLLTYRELLSCEACIHHSFVHGLKSIKIWCSNEHHIRHELCCFQYLQSLKRDKDVFIILYLHGPGNVLGMKECHIIWNNNCQPTEVWIQRHPTNQSEKNDTFWQTFIAAIVCMHASQCWDMLFMRDWLVSLGVSS